MCGADGLRLKAPGSTEARVLTPPVENCVRPTGHQYCLQTQPYEEQYSFQCDCNTFVPVEEVWQEKKTKILIWLN